MKNLSWALHVIALAAIAFLLFSNLNSPAGPEANSSGETGTSSTRKLDDSTSLSIAYIKLETLLTQYNYALALNEQMMSMMNKMETELKAESSAFESDYRKFESKVKTGSFLSQSSMENQQAQLVDRQQKLQQKQYELEGQLMEEQQRVESILYEEIVTYLEEIRTREGYHFILSLVPGSDILVGDPSLDITDEVLKGLNDRYLAKQE